MDKSPFKAEIVDGYPVLLDLRERRPKTFRIRVKKHGVANLGLSRLAPKQKAALENIAASKDFSDKGKREAAIDAGYSKRCSLPAMNRLLARKPIVNWLVKKGVTDEKLAQIISEGLEAIHPLSKDNKPDWNARHKFVSEANKIKDNYPAKRIEIDERSVHINLTGEDVEAARKYKELVGENEIF
jgi:hypothetical protein